jgi:hypothetical protein
MLSITVDTRAVSAMLKALPKEIEIATRGALNDTAKHIRSEASKDIRAKWNIKKMDLDPYFRIQQATRAKLEAEVSMKAKPIPVSKFSPTQTKRGVSVAILKGRKKILKGAFFATMGSGHRGVFRRGAKSRKQGRPYSSLPAREVKTGKWAGTAYRPALPIIEQVVISPVTMWQAIIEKHRREAESFAVRRLRGRLESLIAKRR